MAHTGLASEVVWFLKRFSRSLDLHCSAAGGFGAHSCKKRMLLARVLVKKLHVFAAFGWSVSVHECQQRSASSSSSPVGGAMNVVT